MDIWISYLVKKIPESVKKTNDHVENEHHSKKSMAKPFLVSLEVDFRVFDFKLSS